MLFRSSAVKGCKVTTLLSSETVPGGEDAFPHTVSGVESFCDGFIHLSFQRQDGRRSRAVEIVKMRGCKHEHEVRPAHIGDGGFSVGFQGAAKQARKKVILDDQ